MKHNGDDAPKDCGWYGSMAKLFYALTIIWVLWKTAMIPATCTRPTRLLFLTKGSETIREGEKNLYFITDTRSVIRQDTAVMYRQKLFSAWVTEEISNLCHLPNILDVPDQGE